MCLSLANSAGFKKIESTLFAIYYELKDKISEKFWKMFEITKKLYVLNCSARQRLWLNNFDFYLD